MNGGPASGARTERPWGATSAQASARGWPAATFRARTCPGAQPVPHASGIANQPARDLDYRAVADDTPHRLSDLKAQVVVLNLWATWCGPCLHELPDMDRIARDFGSRGLTVVTFSTEERDRLRAFAEKHPVSTLNVYAADADWLDVRGRPLTLVIDREGARRYDELAPTLERWLKQSA